MPSCPAAPISAKIGCDSSGRKSISAPMPMKIKQRKQLRLDAEVVEDVEQSARLIERRVRQVAEQRAEANRQQQRRLVFLGDRQIDQHAADREHQHGAGREASSMDVAGGLDTVDDYESVKVTRSCPCVTSLPSVTCTAVTVPAQGDRMTLNIFIASMVSSSSPRWTT